MRVTGAPLALATLLAASLAQAQYLISELSFGHAGRISPADNGGKIPYFNLQGNPNAPEVLSNRIILTPLAPGNQRGAVWSEQNLLRNQWITDVDFRANGPERGSGNLNIWLVRDGAKTVGSSSVYTVGKFDGLALVIDTQAGSGGMIRGFLNDGTIDYSQRQGVDQLAFGHCAYSYRNLGRPSQVKMRQTANSFKVEIDGRLCFETDNMFVPTGYQLGITAATPDTPDSFEIFKMVVMTDNTIPAAPPNNNNAQKRPQQSPTKSQPNQAKMNNDDYEFPDEDPDVFQTSKMQFMDLHNRLQNTNHQLSSVHRTVSRHQQQDEKRQEELLNFLGEIKQEMRKLDQIGEFQRRISDLEREVRSLRSDLGQKIQNQERTVKSYLSDHHSTLSQTVLETGPRNGIIIAVILISQVILVAAFLLYKKRRNSMPKKYL